MNVKNHSYFQLFIFLLKNILVRENYKNNIFIIFKRTCNSRFVPTALAILHRIYRSHCFYIVFGVNNRTRTCSQTAMDQHGGLSFNLSHFRRELFPKGGLIRGCMCASHPHYFSIDLKP